MSNKFGKFLMLTAFVSATVASVVYLTSNPEVISKKKDDEDFFDLDAPRKSRVYVPLRTPGGCKSIKSAAESATDITEEKDFTPLFETVQTIQAPTEAPQETTESVEEFFDVDEDGELIEPYSDEQ